MQAGKSQLHLTSFAVDRCWKPCERCCYFLEDKCAIELAGLGEAAVSSEGEPWPEVTEQRSCILHTYMTCLTPLPFLLLHTVAFPETLHPLSSCFDPHTKDLL